MGIVAALLPNTERVYRLHNAIHGRHTLEPCTDWPALGRLCDSEPVHLVVLDLYATEPMSLEPVRQLKRRFPRLIVVAYLSPRPERLHDLFDAGRAGLDGLVLADRDDSPAAFAAILEQAEARGVAAALRGALAAQHPSVRDAVMVAVTRAHERLTTESLARTVSLSRRRLTRRLIDDGFPPPQRILAWGRLIVAAQLLEDHHRSADGVALALHFPSGSAFRNTCQRYLGATPTEIRTLGGATFVIRRLLDEVASASRRTDVGGAPAERSRDEPATRSGS